MGKETSEVDNERLVPCYMDILGNFWDGIRYT